MVAARRAAVAYSAAVGAYGVLSYEVTERGLGAFLMAPVIEPLLFEVGPFDPGAFAFGAGFVLVVGLLAALVPARRAAGAPIPLSWKPCRTSWTTGRQVITE